MYVLQALSQQVRQKPDQLEACPYPEQVLDVIEHAQIGDAIDVLSYVGKLVIVELERERVH
jgi:hypothetical protein